MIVPGLSVLLVLPGVSSPSPYLHTLLRPPSPSLFPPCPPLPYWHVSGPHRLRHGHAAPVHWPPHHDSRGGRSGGTHCGGGEEAGRAGALRSGRARARGVRLMALVFGVCVGKARERGTARTVRRRAWGRENVLGAPGCARGWSWCGRPAGGARPRSCNCEEPGCKICSNRRRRLERRMRGRKRILCEEEEVPWMPGGLGVVGRWNPSGQALPPMRLSKLVAYCALVR